MDNYSEFRGCFMIEFPEKWGPNEACIGAADFILCLCLGRMYKQLLASWIRIQNCGANIFY